MHASPESPAPPTTPAPPPRPLARLLLLLLAAALLAGCQSNRMTTSTRLDVTGPLAIDVESFGGDVIITGDDDARYASVEFEAIALHGKGREEDAAASLAAIENSAEIVPGEIGHVLRVRAKTTHPEPHFQRVHMTITAPLIDGVTVLTRRGRVYVTNVAGECEIETTDGDVRLITRQPLTRPVTIINSDADIDLRMTGASRGEIDAETAEGTVLHRVREGALIIRPETDHDTLNAVLNRGDNEITLRTENGNIRIAVISNPEDIGLRIFEP